MSVDKYAISEQFACVDYSAAKDGPLGAYRLEGRVPSEYQFDPEAPEHQRAQLHLPETFLHSSIWLSVVLLLISAAFIYGACEYFVNGVEWVGRKLGVSQNGVGTVLAAFGTALPESVVTFVAVVFGHDATTKNIGVGAAL